MPSRKSRKVRCCSSCGRRSKGHLGQLGRSCRMDELLREEILGARADIDSTKSVPETPSKKKVPFWKSKSPTKPAKVDSDSDSSDLSDGVEPDVNAQLQSLTNQLGRLSGNFEKLISGEIQLPARDLVPSSGASRTEKCGKVAGKESAIGSVTTTSLAKDKELNVLLSKYNQGEEEYLSSFARDRLSSAQPSNSGEKRKKTLFIHDFLTRPDGFVPDEEDTVTSNSGVVLSFKAKPKHVEPKDVTIAQWITANARIFDILSLSMSETQKAEYSEYVKQVGDLLQIYTESSVMSLDCEHRKHVTATNRAWDCISLHLERYYLRLQNVVYVQDSLSNVTAKPDQAISGSSPSTVPKKSNRHCFAYNSKAGCRHRDNCQYKHRCSERGCGEKHPKHEHELFRSNATSQKAITARGE